MGRLTSELWGNNGMGMADPSPSSSPSSSATAPRDDAVSTSTSTNMISRTAAAPAADDSTNNEAEAGAADASGTRDDEDDGTVNKTSIIAVDDNNSSSSDHDDDNVRKLTLEKEEGKLRPTYEAMMRTEASLLKSKSLHSNKREEAAAGAHAVPSPNEGDVEFAVMSQQHTGMMTTPGAYAMENNSSNNEASGLSGNSDNQQQPAAFSSSTSSGGGTATVTAHLVTDEENAVEKLRERIQELENAPTAVVVSDQVNHRAEPEEEDDDDNSDSINNLDRRKITFRILFILLVVILIIVVAAIGTFGINNDGSSDTPPLITTNYPPIIKKQPTLQTIKERGYIRCRVIPHEYDMGGISQELCRALSAAIFDGNPNRTEFVVMPISQLWSSLDSGDVDIATSWNTGNIGRDVFEIHSGKPKSFSTSYFITGTQVAGSSQDYVDCVNNRDTITGVCKDLVICVPQHTTTEAVIRQHMDGSNMFFVQEIMELFVGLANGTCQVIAGEPQFIYQQLATSAGYTGQYVFGSSLLSIEPQCTTTREDDPQWTDFSTSVLQALFTAEVENITKENATSLFPATDQFFGEEYKYMYQNVIAAMGNWGNIFEQTFGQYIQRNAVNQVKKKNRDLDGKGGGGGMLYSPPLAALEYTPQPHYTNPPGPIPNGTLEAITNRGYLRCAIIPNRPGFATTTTTTTAEGTPRPNTTTIAFGGGGAFETTRTWIGMDIDLCSGLASALFRDRTKVDFVVVEDEIAGFMALTQDMVDVVAGVPYTLQADIKEPTTNRGYTFSPIYFYDDDDDNGNAGERRLALVTNQDATQWSDFVRWTIYGLINAEEHGIHKANASRMPSVDLFGPNYTLMFRLIVLNIGNYGELYERNLGGIIPRRGSNLLNDGSTPLINPLPLDQFASQA